MSCFKGIIQKGDMPDDAQPVGKDGKFVGIEEMPIDVLVFGIRTVRIRALRVLGLFSVTKSSMAEVSKVRIWAREESICWQMGSV